MPIEAPCSRYRKTNLIIYIAVLAAFGLWFGYDGYVNKGFIQKHTEPTPPESPTLQSYGDGAATKADTDSTQGHLTVGKPDGTLLFNRKSPPFFLAAAGLLGIYLATIKNKKLVADENELVFSAGGCLTAGNKVRIPYDSIEKIDRTYFDKKGFFVITYTDKDGNHNDRKISDHKFDNLRAVLEHLTAKIT